MHFTIQLQIMLNFTERTIGSVQNIILSMNQKVFCLQRRSN